MNLENEIKDIKDIASKHDFDTTPDSIEVQHLFFRQAIMASKEGLGAGYYNARLMAQAILEKVPGSKVSVDTFGEWVHVEIDLAELIESEGISPLCG